MRIGDGELGVTVDLPVSLIDDLARKIVDSATPELRLLVAQERTRLAESFWKAAPFAGGAIAIFLGTLFFMPDDKIAKFAGYGISAGLLVGAILVFLDHAKGTPQASMTPPAVVTKDGQKVYPIKVSL